jgi:DNA invertase Pin-like site-specific DNA recombinase
LRESIDTTTATGRLQLHLFAALAEFERELIRERSAAGRERSHTPSHTRTLPPAARCRRWQQHGTSARLRALRFARQSIVKIRLARSGRGRYGPPISERVEITWAGHDEADRTIADRVEAWDGEPYAAIMGSVASS